MLDLFQPPKPPVIQNARRVLLLDAAGEINPDFSPIQPRRPSKFEGMSVDEIREYRKLQYQARKNGTRYVLPAPKVAKPEKKPRVKQTPEERNARRRALLAEKRAQGAIVKQSRKTPYSQLPEEEKQRLRDYQTAYYRAHREEELERAKRRYAALTPEQKELKRQQNEAWRQANRARVNAQDRARRAAAKAQGAGA